MRRAGHHRTVIVACSLYLAGTCLLAQTTDGSASGVVHDELGSPVPAATVTLTSTTQASILETTTNDVGEFQFLSLRPDTYVLRISSPGFRSFERTNVVINASGRHVFGAARLTIGAVTETVVVEGNMASIQARSGERSFTLEGDAIRKIAVNGRSFFGLIELVPGIVPSANPIVEPPSQASHFSANGQRTSSNMLTVDGVSNIDTGDNGANMASINLESVAELKVLTSSYQAEYGRALGAHVQVVTRSGTQRLSGSGYWFGRRSDWNANSWLNNRAGNPKPDTARNDFGFTAGGPVFIGGFNRTRDRLFFFFSQEFQRRRDPVADVRATVPTELERRGDFSRSLDRDGNPFPFIRDFTTGLPCNAFDTRGCFQDGGVLGRIPGARLYQPSLAALSLYPLPNAPGNRGFNYRSQEPAKRPRHEELARIDYNASNAWRVTGRYIQNTDERQLPYGDFAMGSNVPTLRGRTNIPGRNWAASAVGMLGSDTSVQIVVGRGHNAIDIFTTNSQLTRAAAGIDQLPAIFPSAIREDMLPRFRFQGTRIGGGPSGGTAGGAAEINTANAPFANFNTTYDLAGSVTRTLGAHTVKAGLFFQRSLKDQSTFAPFNGLIDFQNDANSPFDTGHPYANAATGVYHTFQQASNYVKPKWRYSNIEWYVQDNWKAGSTLTIDYGLRFYYMTPQWDVSRQASTFLPDLYEPARAVRLFQPSLDEGRRVGFDPVTGQVVPESLIGRVVPGSGDRFNGTRRAGEGVSETLSSGARFKVGPRVGFAYDLSGEQTVILRGGIGVAYDRPQGNTVFDVIRNPPGTQEQQLTWGRFEDLSSSVPLNAPINLAVVDYEWQLPLSTSWNLGLQFGLPLALIGDVAYVGASSRHLPQQRQLNAVPYGATFLPESQDWTRPAGTIPGSTALPSDFLRPYRGYADIRLLEFKGFSNFRSLQGGLSRRFDRGLMAAIHYTWSEALGTGDGDLSPARIDGLDRDANYAPLWTDRPHHLVASFVWQAPTSGHRLIGGLTGGWQLSGVYRWMSGRPYAVDFSIPGMTAANLTGSDGNQNARVVVTGNPGRGWSDDPYRQFDTSVFAAPKPGSIGLESPRNLLSGPPTNNLDLSLSRSFPIGGRRRVEIRLDAFNALNHTQFARVNNTVGFRSLTDATVTNLPYDASGNLVNPNGFGTIADVRPPRQLQLVTRVTF
jgi:hypothetical protein